MTETPWTFSLARRAGGFEELGKLRDGCASAGLSGIDAITAIDSYLEYGKVTEADRDALSSLQAAERDTFLSERWGSGGGRVAALVIAGL